MMSARFAFRWGWQGVALLWVLALPVGGFAQTPQERAQVEAFLKEWHRTNLVTDADIEALKAMGKQALPLLAASLPDKDLGYLAESAMQRIDSNGAMPYLLKNLPNRDPNIQRDTFKTANRRMMEYDWFVRAGQPQTDPARPAARYPSNTQVYPFRKEIHDAAVQCLQANTSLGAEMEAIKTLGLTGTQRDVPLLRKYAVKEGGTPSDGYYRVVSVAAMARLGDKQALDTILAELEKPVTPHPAEPFFRDTGRKVEPRPRPRDVVASTEDGLRLRTAAFEAGFAMDRRLIPALLRHMDDPPGQFHGDYADPSPAHEAMNALAQIVYGKEYAEQIARTPDQWKQWGREHEKEFVR